jgi:hypothetical protein
MHGTYLKKVNIFICHSIVFIAIMMELITATHNWCVLQTLLWQCIWTHYSHLQASNIKFVTIIDADCR